MKTNKRPNSDTRVDRQLRAGKAMYRGGYISMIERQLAEAHEEIARLNKSLSNASAIYDAACEQRDHYIAESNRLAEELKQERGASFRDQRDRLAEALPVAMARAYASGYQHGHEDTVETQFIPVHHTETKDYFADNIRQMMIDGSQPEATEALAAVKGGPQ